MQFDDCPICGSKLITSDHGWQICKNNCYFVEKWNSFTNHCFIHPFDEKLVKLPFYDSDSAEGYIKKRNIAYEIIKYWKTDDRYIAEILSK